MSLFLAYDGSLNGQWIGNYAIRIAAGTPDRRLIIVHVEDANVSGEPLHDQLQLLTLRARRMNVETEVRILPMHDGVFGGLDAYLPQGPETLVVCGARIAAGRRGVLAGTVSEQLLRRGRYNVLSVRVLQPGLLGHPRSLLLALPEDGDAVRAVPFLKPMTAAAERLDILYVTMVSHRHFRNMSDTDAARLDHDAQSLLAAAENTVITGTGMAASSMDRHARVSDDWPKQVAVEAGRFKSDLILTEMPAFVPAALSFAHPIEELMRIAPSDVAAFRGVAG